MNTSIKELDRFFPKLTTAQAYKMMTDAEQMRDVTGAPGVCVMYGIKYNATTGETIGDERVIMRGFSPYVLQRAAMTATTHHYNITAIYIVGTFGTRRDMISSIRIY